MGTVIGALLTAVANSRSGLVRRRGTDGEAGSKRSVPGDGGGTTDPVAGGSADREAQRLLTLDRLDVIYTAREQVFDDLVALVAEHCSTSFAALSFIERELQRFKVSFGFSLVEIDRELGVFDRVVRSGQLISVPDTSQDVRLASNAQVTGPPFIRSYIGAPVRAFGEVVGALCVMSDQPDAFTAKDIASVQRFTDFVEALLELRWRRSQDEECRRLCARLDALGIRTPQTSA